MSDRKEIEESGVADSGAIAADLVRFFRALRPEARREYEALAAQDRELGEDVGLEKDKAGA